MSNKIIGPDTWGPVVWHALHYITLGYPDNPSQDKKDKYKQFFTLLSDTLPCSICANHFVENLIKMPLSDEVLQNKESLVKWLIDFHNVVNEMNKKPIIKYEVARKLIEENIECKHNIIYQPKEQTEIIIKENVNNLSKPGKNLFSINNIYYLFGLLLFIILIGFLFKNKSV
jgi:hypothetical protein